MGEPLELQIARSKVAEYEHEESIVRDSKHAQDCLDCEAWLELGVEALEWLERAEEVFTEASARFNFDFSNDLVEALETLHLAWLRPRAFAEQWIARCEENGYQIRNVEGFRSCCTRGQEWLARNSQYKLAREAREQRFAEEPW
jgi:glycine/D-amino acid oxidase-like deaminating enzyme